MPNDQDPGSQNQEPKYVTVDDIGNIVNAALTSRLPKMLAPALDAAIKPLMDKLNAAPPPPPPPADDDGDSRKKKANPELLAMAAKVEAMEKALASEKEAVAAANKKAREERSFSELRATLEGKVRPELLDMVAKNLFLVESRVETDEQGTALFKSSKVAYPGADPEDVRLPLKDGVEAFLKSDAAKHLLPAPNAGAGSQPLPKRGPSPHPGGTDLSKPATTDAEKVRRAIERERRAQQLG